MTTNSASTPSQRAAINETRHRVRWHTPLRSYTHSSPSLPLCLPVCACVCLCDLLLCVAAVQCSTKGTVDAATSGHLSCSTRDGLTRADQPTIQTTTTTKRDNTKQTTTKGGKEERTRREGGLEERRDDVVGLAFVPLVPVSYFWPWNSLWRERMFGPNNRSIQSHQQHTTIHANKTNRIRKHTNNNERFAFRVR